MAVEVGEAEAAREERVYRGGQVAGRAFDPEVCEGVLGA